MLAKRVLYRKYAGYLYIINLNTSKSYVFEGIAEDLIDFLADAENICIENLITHIESEYEIEDPEQMRTEVKDFVMTLQKEGILEVGISEKNSLN